MASNGEVQAFLALAGGLRISAVYVALIILMGAFLAFLVINQRRTKLVGIGDGGHHAVARMIRVHGNFCENAPFAMASLILLPLLGASPLVVHAVGLLFLAGRIAHAYGLSRTAGSSPGRVAGMIMTLTSLLISAASLLALVLIR
ncbi:MAG: MAPEG family protein [Methylocystis sp.]|jgi:uncharacterized membrane protein YecN with MAPEG domain|nr:MAPEG family protein [Methylocystis sp.]MCA3582368.1 MAPEG family protein [Methylocystis sp.]MCA3588263.1 MAPEG family protein [Methylocystis sp.]MCA3590181.1 MAPEG family protein [Methylocystis sp.]